MRHLFTAVALALLAAVPALPAAADDSTGVRLFEMPVSSRGAPLSVTVWYPAAGGGTPVLVGDNRLFRGTAGMMDAPVADGRHPLVLVSHGSGGSIRTLGWIASHLAAAGFIVAGPDHPGTTTGNSTPADTIRVWERTADLSALLTAMLADPTWSRHIDGSRIGAMGFSLGGHTVLAIAGARVNRESYARYCDENPAMPDCVWFASGNVDMRAVDQAAFEGSSHDPRINSVVAIDPSIVHALTPESLSAIFVPVYLINLESPGSAWWIAVQADGVAQMIPSAWHDVVRSAHLTFLAQCQPDARQFLEEVGETDPLCDDRGDRTRAEVHAQLAAMIEGAFRRTLLQGQP